MRFFLLVGALLAAGPEVAGQEAEIKKGLATCASLEVEAARLDCFEQLARAVAQVPPAAPPNAPESKFKGSAAPGTWKVETAVDPFDDTKTVALGLVDATESMQLMLLCQKAKPQVFVSIASRLESDVADTTQVLTRLAKAKSEARRWPVSTNHKAAFYPGDVGAFIRRLLAGDHLLVQLRPFDAAPISATFELGALPNVVAQLKEACHLP